MFDALALMFGFSEGALLVLAGVFVRVGAVVALLPGFGEETIPYRIKLAAAIAFTAIVWPAALPMIEEPADTVGIGQVAMLEAIAGLGMGIAVRLSILALQFAGSIAAQSTSLAQIFGPGATPDPMPAVGNILVITGVALAMALGLHVKAAMAMVDSYGVLPFATSPLGSDFAQWGVARASAALSLAFTLAAPFLIASFAYNVALGAINRAMPQLMVAFIGAPAITGAGILLLVVSGPVLLDVWARSLDRTLAAPFEMPQ